MKRLHGTGTVCLAAALFLAAGCGNGSGTEVDLALDSLIADEGMDIPPDVVPELEVGDIEPADVQPDAVVPPDTTADSFDATPTDEGGESGNDCGNPPQSGSCLIAGTCYADGAANPANICQVCTASKNQTVWSNATDGFTCQAASCSGTTWTSAGTCLSGQCTGGASPTDCDDGKACTNDSCAPETGCSVQVQAGMCLIEGVCHPDGEINPSNACQVCNSSADQTGWSSAGNFTPCAADRYCMSGICEAFECPTGFVPISAGQFTMGSPETEPGRTSDEVQHVVILSHSFCMKVTEVTQGEWQSLMSNNPSSFTSCGSTCPVERVSWWDSVAYCNARSAQEGLEQCYSLTGCTGTPGATVGRYKCTGVTSAGLDCTGYRLPTDAEWEYAARAGTTTGTYNGTSTLKGAESPNTVLDPIAWFVGNSKVTYSGSYDCTSLGGPNASCGTNPVKSKQANAWGLYDMLGNVQEWIGDYYGDYPTGTVTDPTGPSTGTYRVTRGGGWVEDAKWVRAAVRPCCSGPDYQSPDNGFRLVRSGP